MGLQRRRHLRGQRRERPTTINHTYTAEGNFTVGLRITDNGGATDLTARAVEVIANYAPTAALTATPNPVVIGQTVTFNGSGSSDPDGTIAKYEWDLDANGTFERNSGASRRRPRPRTRRRAPATSSCA